MWKKKKKKKNLYLQYTLMSHIFLRAGIHMIVIFQQTAEKSEKMAFFYHHLWWILNPVAIIELWLGKNICKGTDIICNLAKLWMGSVFKKHSVS